MKTVHLPFKSKDPKDSPLNVRLHFETPSTPFPIHFEAFSSNDQRVFRLEITALLGHIQINFNGLQSPWHRANHQNYLEITNFSIDPIFKLNGKILNVKFPEPVSNRSAFRLTFDESAQPDADWFDLVNDPEILESLKISPPIWQAPLLSESPELEQLKLPINPATPDYIVYDDERLVQVQMSSGIPLPKLATRKPKPKSQSREFLRFLFKKQSTHLPVLRTHYKSASSSSASKVLGTVAICGFTIYLAVLLHLSKMTSLRPSAKKNEKSEKSEKLRNTEQKSSASHLQSQSHSLSGSQLKLPTSVNPFKSPSSRTILIDLPDAPLFKSSSSSSVLKVSVPAAAFSLADNRHILFPSKLRK